MNKRNEDVDMAKGDEHCLVGVPIGATHCFFFGKGGFSITGTTQVP
ncbi:hypothetical protein SLEP1_g12362 [Rubroshorea leprosula]|uniref:Uncharacterized protein n=1 Tax=Rubroshorea leprosula TaxID=152421 RepID=A0AAV5IKA6_9ROSI|nr:hypothetical protein SLEP1_g12362 [Rubroshorea leprosula]